MIIIPTGRPLLAVVCPVCPLFVLQQYVYGELLEELIARTFRRLVTFGLTSNILVLELRSLFNVFRKNHLPTAAANIRLFNIARAQTVYPLDQENGPSP
jgi:hypothetical protein